MNVDCTKFELLITARDAGTITSSDTLLLDVHLASCARCTAVVATGGPGISSSGDQELPIIQESAYELGREVARGGMGRIRAARDLRIGRGVAVKELIGAAPDLAARFEREARVTARLQHPGIVPIYEIGRWPDGTPFYTMRMVDGRTLRDALRGKPTLEERLALLPSVIAATEAVAFAHSRDVIHRDLTPNNILVGAYGETVVIDWGLAKDLGADRDQTSETAGGPYREEPATDAVTIAGAIVGTAPYMPPEQARGARVDERADVYALGAILYHLLAGHAPYRGGSAEEVIGKVLAGPPEAVDRISPDAPRELVSLVSKAMSRDLGERYASAGVLAEELRRFQNGRIVEAHRYSRAELLRRWVRRHRALVVASVTALVAVGVAGSIGFAGVVRERDRAEVERIKAQTVSASLLVEQGRQELLAGHPMRAAAWLSEAYSAGERSVSLRFLLAAALRQVESLEYTLDCPVARGIEVSPDGTLLAAACGSEARLWTIKDGRPVMTSLGDTLLGVRFTHDSTRVAAYSRNGDTWIWHARTGALIHRLEGNGSQISAVHLTPNDDFLVTLGHDGAARVWSVATGALVRTIEIATSPIRPVNGGLTRDGKRLIASTAEGHARVYDLLTGEQITQVEVGKMSIGRDLSADGTRAITCGADKIIQLWDVSVFSQLRTLSGHADAVFTCRFSPDGTRILSTSSDRTAKVWETNTGRLLVELPHGTSVTNGLFMPDGRQVVTVSNETVKVWDVDSGAMLGSIDDPHAVAENGNAVRIARDGALIVVANGDGHIRGWARLTRAHRAGFALPAPATLRGMLLDGARVVSHLPDGTGELWDPGRGVKLEHIPIREPIEVNAWGDRLAALAGPRRVCVLDAHRGTTVACIDTTFDVVRLDLGDDNRRLLITNEANHAALYETETGALVWSATGRPHVPAVSANGRYLASWTEGRLAGYGRDHAKLELIRADTGAVVTTIEMPMGSVPWAAFDASGSHILTLSPARVLDIWEAATGRHVASHAGIANVGVSRVRDLITTIDLAGVTVYRTDTGAAVASSSPGSSLQLSWAGVQIGRLDPTGELLATNDLGTSNLNIWEVSSGRLLSSVRLERLGVLGDASLSYHQGEPQWSSDGSTLAVVQSGLVVWATPLEHRSPEEIARIVRELVPLRVVNGALAFPRATVRGKVTHHGAPVGNALVTVRTATEPSHTLQIETDAAGNYTLAGLPVTTFQITGQSDERGAFGLPVTVFAHDGNNEVDIAIDLAGSIAGRVVDDRGQPVARAEVAVSLSGKNGNDVGRAITDQQGNFKIAQLSGGGDYNVFVAVGGGPRVAQERRILVRDGDTHVSGVSLVATPLRVSDAPGSLIALPPSSEASLRSAAGNERTPIAIHNRTGRVLDVHWIDFDGRRRGSRSVSPGEAFQGQSYAGHVFVVTETDGTGVAVFVATSGPASGHIDGP